MNKYMIITVDTKLLKGIFNTQEVKKGLFKGKSVNRVYQTVDVDKKQLALDISTACNELADKGYELVSNTTIESGIFNHDADINSGWGFGMSVTSGVVLTFKKS